MKPFTLIWFIWQYTAQLWNGISGAHSPYLLYRSGPRSQRLAKGRQPFHYKSLAAAVPRLCSLLLQTMVGPTQADSLGQDGPNSVVVFMVSTAESLGTLQVLPHWWSLFTLSKEGKQPLFTSFFPPWLSLRGHFDVVLFWLLVIVESKCLPGSWGPTTIIGSSWRDRECRHKRRAFHRGCA